jgi:hypothetical protein
MDLPQRLGVLVLQELELVRGIDRQAIPIRIPVGQGKPDVVLEDMRADQNRSEPAVRRRLRTFPEVVFSDQKRVLQNLGSFGRYALTADTFSLTGRGASRGFMKPLASSALSALANNSPLEIFLDKNRCRSRLYMKLLCSTSLRISFSAFVKLSSPTLTEDAQGRRLQPLADRNGNRQGSGRYIGLSRECGINEGDFLDVLKDPWRKVRRGGIPIRPRPAPFDIEFDPHPSDRESLHGVR